MKLLVSFVVFLTIVNTQLTTGENNYSVANLKTIHTIIDTVKTAKDIWNIVKDLPPTFADVLQTISKLANQKNSTKQDVKNASSNNTNRDDGSKTRQSSYDFVIDLTRPTDIYGELKAYPLSFPRGKKAYDDKTKPNDQVSSRFIVNVIGRYNVGKTYILRLLGNIDLVHSFTERTNGISVSLPNPRDEHDPSLALIDTAGSRTPVDYNSETFPRLAYERQISDAFIQEIALNSSEIFLVVLNQLTLDDQLYLKMLRKRLKDKNIKDREIKQRLLIVHNYFNLQTVDEVERIAQYELQNIFNAKKQREGHWLSHDFKHFILANGNSEAGRTYNERTLHQLLTMIKASDAKQVNDVLEHIMYEIKQLLERFLEEKPINHHEDSENKKSSSIAATVKLDNKSQKDQLHVSRQHQIDIELEIKQLSVEELKPESLWFICSKEPLSENVILSNNLKFNEDGSVYVDYSSQFIPDIHIAQLNNYGDIQILIECLSCSKESIKVTLKGNKLIVQGERIGTKMSKDYLNTRKVGKFELELPISNLDDEKAFDFTRKENYFREGLITIIVPVLRETSDDSTKAKNKKKGWFS